jgi:hypothetical protein
MALAEGATPDWSTMVVDGPIEAVGRHGVAWIEWAAIVKARIGNAV